MSARRWLSAFLLTLAVVAGAALWLQQQSGAQLWEEIALLRDENQKLAQLRAENAKLVAAQAPAAELERLRGDRAAVTQLRTEIEKLKTGVDEQERALRISRVAKRATDEPAPASAHRVLSAANWKNAGRVTPMAALETVLWAGTSGDLDAMVGALAFDDRATKRAQEMFDSSPATRRQEYGSPFRMVAALMAREMSVSEARVTEEKSLNPDPGFTSVNATLNAELTEKDGDTSTAHFEFVKISEGWLLKVPAKAIEHFSAEQRGAVPAK